jgi:cellulose synthase (UDP-forming)
MFLSFHIPLLLLACGIVFFTITVQPNEHRLARLVLCSTVLLAVVVYLDWHSGLVWHARPEQVHGVGWVWYFYIFEFVAFAEFGLMLFQISRMTDRLPQANKYERQLRGMDPELLPHVDVWVATYNEQPSILEKTIIGATNLDWPKDKLHVYVLDDGRREWLRAMCAEYGVNYITRPDNQDRKAGNHNHALTISDAPFIVSMDADFVPSPNFIYRTLGFFEDLTVAVVQTPQCFYNAEPMRKNLGMVPYLPDELDFFYRVMQPCRDAWDAAFYCGSAAILRRQAIVDIGGFVTVTDIEDQATAIKLLSRGYKTRYLNEQLSVGLAAESNAVLHDQRNRWCRGSLQILFTDFGPFSRNGPRFIHRLLFLQTHWVMSSVTPLTYLLCPILFLWFGWNAFPAAHPTDILMIPVLTSITITTAVLWLSRWNFVPFFWHGLQLFMAFELLPNSFASLVKPFGKPLLKINPVTPKGAAASGKRIDFKTLTCLLTVIAVVILGLFHAANSDRLGGQSLEMATLLFWITYMMVIVLIAALICFEPMHHRSSERFNLGGEAGVLHFGEVAWPIKIVNISFAGARLRLQDTSLVDLNRHLRMDFKLSNQHRIGCSAVYIADKNEIAVRFDPLEKSVRRALIRDMYANEIVQRRQFPRFQFRPVMRQLGRLMKTS